MIRVAMTMAEFEVATRAAETLSPDTPEARSMVEGFMGEMMEGIFFLAGHEAHETRDPDGTENEWSALADGLDVMASGTDEEAMIAAVLADRVRRAIDISVCPAP